MDSKSRVHLSRAFYFHVIPNPIDSSQLVGKSPAESYFTWLSTRVSSCRQRWALPGVSTLRIFNTYNTKVIQNRIKPLFSKFSKIQGVKLLREQNLVMGAHVECSSFGARSKMVKTMSSTDSSSSSDLSFENQFHPKVMTHTPSFNVGNFWPAEAVKTQARAKSNN